MDIVNILAINIRDDPAGFQIFGFAGVLVNILRILIPILLVVLGSIDLSKAVIAQKDDDIKKAQSTLVKRVIAGLVIFFIPAIVLMVMNLAGNEATTGEGQNCWRCFVDSPMQCIRDGREMANNPNMNGSGGLRLCSTFNNDASACNADPGCSCSGTNCSTCTTVGR